MKQKSEKIENNIENKPGWHCVDSKCVLLTIKRVVNGIELYCPFCRGASLIKKCMR